MPRLGQSPLGKGCGHRSMTLMQGIKVLDLSRRIIIGDVIDKVQAARELVALALELSENEADLHQYLSDAARMRADAIADAAEALKVGS